MFSNFPTQLIRRLINYFPRKLALIDVSVNFALF